AGALALHGPRRAEMVAGTRCELPAAWGQARAGDAPDHTTLARPQGHVEKIFADRPARRRHEENAVTGRSRYLHRRSMQREPRPVRLGLDPSFGGARVVSLGWSASHYQHSYGTAGDVPRARRAK